MYITFEHPQYLWYLLSVPLLVVSHYAFLKYTKRKAMRFANFQALKRVADEKILTKNRSILIIRIITLVCIILSIAGTTIWYQGVTSSKAFVLAIDTSSSMTANDFKPTRIEAAKKYARTFVDNIADFTTVGIVSFSGAAFVETVPTIDKNDIYKSIDGIEIAHVGGTDIPGAIITSTNLLLTTLRGKAIILITDGSNTVSYFTKDPILEGIKYAKANKVTIHTIGLGTTSGPIGYLPEYYNITSVYDETTLKVIANSTGGKYYYVQNTEELVNTYKDILSDTTTTYIDIDLRMGLMIITLCLIFLDWGLISTRFRSIP